MVRFSHFIAKLVTRLEALGSTSMRLTCFSRAPGLVKPPAVASASSSWSGPVFHRKNERREASSRLVRANSTGQSCPLRPANRAVKEIGAGQYCRYHLLDSLIEASATLAPGCIKRHEAGDVFGAHRPAESPSRQVFGNLLRAGSLADWLPWCAGIADKNQGAAGGLRDTRGS